MLTHDDLAFLLKKKFPEFIHGRDYWVGHKINQLTNKQVEPAFIVSWNIKDYDEPKPEDIAMLVEKYSLELEELRKARAEPS